MTNPFSADSGNPFLSPYKAPENPASSGSSIKPFAGKDLSPQGIPTLGEIKAQGPGPMPPIPSASPFLDRNFGASFPATPAAPTPIAEPETHSFPAFTESKSPFPISAKPISGASSAIFPKPTEAPFRPAEFVESGSAPMNAEAPTLPTGFGTQAIARKSQIMPLAEMDRVNKPEFFVTTSSTVQGYTIEKYLGILSVEVVVPKDLLFRNPAPHGDLHRLKAAEEELQRVRIAAIKDLEGRGRELNADGIIGVTLQFSQFDTIVCLCSAVGTAIRLVG